MRFLIAFTALSSALAFIPKTDAGVTVPPALKVARHESQSRAMSIEFGFLDDADHHKKVCRAR